MDDTLKKLGGQILGELQGLLGSAWDSFTDEEKELAKAVGEDAAKLAVRAAAGEDVSAERAHIEAQLANFKAVAARTMANLLWAAAQRVFQVGLALLLK